MNEQIDYLDDILIEFDEMGFAPTNFLPDHDREYYAIDWKKRLINALVGYRKSEWISIEDRLPENYKHVIVCDEYGNVGEAFHFKEYHFEWVDNENRAFATHWMPLPEPPKTKGGAE